MKIASRVQSLGNYVFSQANFKAGTRVLDLGAGNPVLPPSEKTREIFAKLAQDPLNYRYPGYKATPILFAAIKKFYQKNFNVELLENNLLPLLGAKDGVNALSLALADRGDEVLIPDPGYPAYRSLAILHGLKPVAYQLIEENNFRLDILALEKLRTKKTKFIWVNFPSNPTGQIPDKKVLTQLVEWCLKNKIWLVYDNAYLNIRFDDEPALSILEIPKAEKIAVEICSLSKSHSLAGLRIGWVVGNRQVIDAVGKVKSQQDSGLSLVLQKLAAAVLSEDDREWQKLLIKNYQDNRMLLQKLMHKLGLDCSLPPGSLYLWIKVPSRFKDGQALSNFLNQEKNIIVTPGNAFGKSGEKYVRVSVTADPELIKEFL